MSADALRPARGETFGGADASTIALNNRQRARKIELRLLKQIVSALLSDLKIGGASLEIVLVGAVAMRRLNETFLRHEGPTDVLAFDYRAGQASRLSQSLTGENGDRRDACPALRGEIFVCVDEAIRQAKQFNTTWQSEVVRYLIHGVLHLTGHDDTNAAARRRMKRMEDGLLRKLARRFSLAQIGCVPKLSV